MIPGKNIFKAVGHFLSQVHPAIIRLGKRSTIVPKKACNKIGFIFWQIDFHIPTCLCKQIKQTDDTTHTAILIFLGKIIYRSSYTRCVTKNSKVGLKPTTGPWPPHSDIPEFNCIIIINKRFAIFFIHSSPYFTTNLGQYK